jgi:chemotaxis protein methyltransferase CheR
MNAADFTYVCGFVRDESAIVLEPGKEYLVESRLLTLARKVGLPSIEDLIGQVRTAKDPALKRKVVDAMTTNESSFFRDIHPFETLKKHILPEIIARRQKERELSIWCGAASSGQEPFTIMMILAEYFPQVLDWNLKFIATDLSTEILARARSGRFSQLEVNRGLPATLLVKHFTRQGTEWEFSEKLRRRVNFQELNLIKDWPVMPPADLVFLRNVLIYFDVETKKAILGRVRRLLRPGGTLFLGGAETTLNLDDGFVAVVKDRTSCYQLRFPQ